MFEFVTAIRIEPEARVARGRAAVLADHPLFADHFPEEPLLPGTLAIEIAAQICGPLAEEAASDGRLAFLAMVRGAKLHVPIELPAAIDIEARLEPLSSARSAAEASATLRVDGAKAATAELTFVLMHRDGPSAALDARRDRLARWRSAW